MDPRFNLWQGWFQTEVVAMEHRKRKGLSGLAAERWLVPMATVKHDNDGLHGRALRWVGRNLVRWGWRLQQRYGAAGTSPTWYPAKSIH